MKTLLIGIDFQNDFMDDGSLPVHGGRRDARRFADLIQRCSFDEILLSQDTHEECQIFHPMWWEDLFGEAPAPFTVISKNDVDAGTWIPRFAKGESVAYLEALEREAKRNLIVWNVHCIRDTWGCAIVDEIEGVLKGKPVRRLQKGFDRLTEMYGVFRPEIETQESQRKSEQLLSHVADFDRLVIGGEAKSHCVLESVRQLVNYLKQHDLRREIFLLRDCMHSIAGFEAETDAAYQMLASNYPLTWIASTDWGTA